MTILKDDERGLPAALKEAHEALRAARDAEQPRLKRIDAAVSDSVYGQAAGVYVPRRATREYRMLVEQSRFNVLELVVTSVAQNLFVDGFRPTGPNGRAPDMKNSPIWDAVWQPNRMDARQAALYRAAIRHGTSYALALPGDAESGPVVDGKAVPAITPMSACRMTALYEDPANDEWPELAMEMIGERRYEGKTLSTVRIFDEANVYTVESGAEGGLRVTKVEEHGLTVCPVVRFKDRYDLGVPCGKVEPLLWLQQQVNQITFSLAMTLQYAAFRQRYVTGMEVQVDANGKPKPPLFNVAVDQMLQAEGENTKFGEFSQTDVSGYLESRDKVLLQIASVAQIPPQNLVIGAGISNVSAESLELLAAGHRQDIAEHQTSFGESIEQLMRLCGKAMDNDKAWSDMSAQVFWRDTSQRSPGAIVDALGKAATMLSIPPKALWRKLPGVTDQDLLEMEQMADEADGLRDKALADAIPPAPPPEQLIGQGASNVVPVGAARSAGPARPARQAVPAGA